MTTVANLCNSLIGLFFKGLCDKNKQQILNWQQATNKTFLWQNLGNLTSSPTAVQSLSLCNHLMAFQMSSHWGAFTAGPNLPPLPSRSPTVNAPVGTEPQGPWQSGFSYRPLDVSNQTERQPIRGEGFKNLEVVHILVSSGYCTALPTSFEMAKRRAFEANCFSAILGLLFACDWWKLKLRGWHTLHLPLHPLLLHCLPFFLDNSGHFSWPAVI